MAYLMKYKGKYRLKAEIDLNTNDFQRSIDKDGNLGSIEQNDVYIKCKKGRIYHQGRNILKFYCDKLGTGRNVVKSIGAEIGLNIQDYKVDNTYNYEKFYNDVEKNGKIFDIEETDEEVEFKFKDKDIEFIANFVYPMTGGANISPFSTSNLPKSSYEINKEDLEEYKKITSVVPKEDKLHLGRLTTSFISDIPKKYKEFKGKNIKAIQKKSMLKGKEFIHSLGINIWKDYLNFLKNNLDK